MAQRAGIIIDAKGNIEYENIGSSKGDIEITSQKGSITQNGVVQTLGASDNIKIDAFVNFTNNNKITAANNLYIKVGNLLANYGIISSKKDLTLISENGDINNYINSEIIGGKGKTSFIAKRGTVNQNSLHSIIINGDYSLDVENFVNTGKVDIAGNLTLNVANDLTNEEGALIYSGGNMELNVVNNLTNKTGAAIYSQGNLTIQKYALANPLHNPSNNKINKFENISGKIISYNGDLSINATIFKNYRSADNLKTVILQKTSENQSWYEDKASYSERDQYSNDGPSLHGGTSFGNSGINLNRDIIPHKTDLYVSFRDGWALYSYIERANKYRRIDDDSNIKAVIQSNNGKVTINSDQFTNQSGEIYAKDNVDITANSFFKNINNPISYTVSYTCWADGGECFIDRFNKDQNGNFDGSYTLVASLGASSSYEREENLASIPGIIKSGEDVDINSPQKTDNGSIEEKVRPASYTDKDFVSSANDGVVNLKIDQYFKGSQTQGLFEKSSNPNSPLFETRSQFIDQSAFFGSNYFYQKIGLNLSDVQTQLDLQNQRMIGDQFFQNQIISEQLMSISKNSFLLSSSETNVNNEIKNLLDNASDEYARLGLTANTGLSQSQINNLQKDIIWFETKVIDGATYIVPTIYLSQDTRNNIKNNGTGNINNSLIFAGGDVNIVGGNLKNNDGSIIAKNQIDISANSIINQQDSLIASTQGNVDLTSSTEITNSHSKITGNDVNISASLDVSNNNFSEISANNNLDITSLNGSIINKSEISSNNNLTLTAAKDVVNSSTITTNAQNLYGSGNDSYIKLESKYSDSGSLKSTLIETASLKGGNITINAGEDFNNYAANIIGTKNTLADNSVTSGNVTITAGNDVNVETLELHNRTETSWGHKSKGGSLVVDTTTNIGSNITSAGNISLTSTGLGLAAEQTNIDIKNAQIQAQYDADVIAYNQALAAYNAQPYRKGQSAPTAPTDPVFYSDASSDINITGSKIIADENVNINADGNVIIANAVDSNFRDFESHKKGSTKYSKSTQIDYTESAVKSEINGNNININSNNYVLVQGSNINADTDLSIGKYSIAKNPDGTYQTDGSGNYITTQNTTLSNLIVKDAILNEYHYAHTQRGYHGVAKVGAQSISATIGLADLYLNQVFAFTDAILPESLIRQGLNMTPLSDSTKDKLTMGNLKDRKDDLKDTTIYNIKEKTFYNNSRTHSVASNLNAGDDVDLISNDNILLQASNIAAGTNDNATTAQVNVDTDNLYIATTQETDLTTKEDKTTRTLMFNNWNEGSFKTDVINTEISSSKDNYNFNVANTITAGYNQNDVSGNKETGFTFREANSNLEYLNHLQTNNDNSHINTVLYNPVEETTKEWHDATRGLTDAGTALVAVGAVAAVVLTAGTATTLVGAVGTAVASTAAATASVSATNSSMNAEGGIGSQTKTISKDTWDATTSDEALKSYAIAGATAGLTYGITQGVNSLSETGNATSSTNSATTLSPPSELSNSTTLSVNTNTANLFVENSNNINVAANSSSTLTSRFVNALQDSAIQSISTATAQSAINGDNFGDTLKNSLQYLVINAAGQLVANEIGNAVHPTDQYGNQLPAKITTAEQLTLHAGLGCGMASAMGNDCASGAAAGVIGELTANTLNNNTDLTRQQIIESSKLAGAFAAAGVAGPDDGNSVFGGSQIARNAAENNAVFKQRPLVTKNNIVSNFLFNIDSKGMDDKNIQLAHEQLFFEDEQGGNIGFFSDSTLKEESGSILNQYVTVKSGYDDALMREAVGNVSNITKPYSLLGFDSCSGKFNCQDWAQQVRVEYNRLNDQKNLEIWNNTFNYNLK